MHPSTPTLEPAAAIHPYARSLGLLSIGCGGAMLAAPRLFATLFALPPNRHMLQALGARDVLIGGAILVPATRRLGLSLRSLADAGDGALIASETARRSVNALHGGVALAVAGLSAATALWLALRGARSAVPVRV